jgi:uncharacterized protein (TIGR03067 family)
MRKLLACVVVFSLSALIAVAGGEKKKAAPKIEGSWTGIEIIVEGKKVPKEAFDDLMYKLVFKDGKYNESVKGMETEAGTYTIDATKNPITIDYTVVSEGEAKGKIQLAILKVEGDNLTIALAKHGSKDRPKNFDGSDDFTVVTLKRNK